jgi:radical SAM superfamily enzyme YgiQ (UPF0313 family)
MKVGLITASTFDGLSAGRAESLDEDSPVGVLTLAAALRVDGVEVAVFDLTQFFRDFAERGDLCGAAAEWIADAGADLFGFSTICSTYPFTLRLANEVRRRAPDRPIILGGPQATVTDRLAIQHFPCVDVVVRGEADHVLPTLVRAIGTGSALSDVSGITFRENGIVRRTDDAPLVDDLDALPDAAYDLDTLLPRRTAVSVELGRGCPFACEFCSTNDFFRRRFRLKSPQRVIAQMRRLHEQYGHERFSLVHDMFTVDRRKVAAFCEAMQASGGGLKWTCSARTDCVDAELLELMAQSGCVGVFFGVESGSPDQQRRMNKHLDLDEARRAIECASRNGIPNTVSLIIGFPDETVADLRQTVGFMMDALRHDHAKPQLHLLAPLAATPIAVRWRESIWLDAEHWSDACVSAAGIAADSPEYALIAAHPDLFINFYQVPTAVPRAYLNELRLFLPRATRRCRWLLVALDQEAGGILAVFDAWLAWRPKPDQIGRYYQGRAFVDDLLRFVEETYAGRGHAAVDVMLAYFQAFLASDVPDTGFEPLAIEGAVERQQDAVPVLPPETRLLRISGSVLSVIEALRARRAPLDADGRRDTALLVRRTPPRWHELSELPPVIASVLQLCDGSRRVSEVMRDFADASPQFGDLPPEAVCSYVLDHLRDARALAFRRSPAPARAPVSGPRTSGAPAPNRVHRAAQATC